MKSLPASERLARVLTATAALAFVASGCGMSSPAGQVSAPFEFWTTGATTLTVTSSEPGDCDPLNDKLDFGLRPLCK